MQRRAVFLAATLALLTGCGSLTNQTGTAAGTAAQVDASAAPSDRSDVPTRVAPPDIAPAAANAEQQQAMRDPQQLVHFWAERVQQAQYAEIEPLLDDSLRQAFVMRTGGVAQYYQAEAQQQGALQQAAIVGARTPYDSDDIVTVDVDLQYASALVRQELDTIRTEQGWKIVNFGPRAEGALANITLTPETREQIKAPEQTLALYADLLRQERYSRLDPIFTFYARQTFGAPGSVEKSYRDDAQRLGKLGSYTIVASQPRTEDGDEFYEIDADLYYERAASKVRIVLAKTDQGWKINHIVPRNEG